MHQLASPTIALLHASPSGVVVSSIHPRDQTCVYAQKSRAGRPEHELSPEQAQAVDLALGRIAQEFQTA